MEIVPKDMQATVIDQISKAARPIVGDVKRPDHLDDLDKKLITGDNRLPNYFNSRDSFDNCKSAPVHDQKLCDSAWAFTTSGMLSDRFCY